MSTFYYCSDYLPGMGLLLLCGADFHRGDTGGRVVLEPEGNFSHEAAVAALAPYVAQGVAILRHAGVGAAR